METETYTPDVKLREVDISEYWSPIVKGIVEFGEIAVAENPEFNKLAACIYRVLQESFIKTATDYGVSRWEKMMGISPTSNATLEDRKAAVLTHLNTNLPYTVPVLKQMLIGLLGEDNFTMIINNGIASRMNDLVPGTIPQIIADLLPKDTSIVVAARIPDLAMISDDLIWTFVDSVGTAFNFAAVILLLLVPVGLVYRAKRPSR